MKPFLRVLPQYLLILLFIYAAASKLLEFDEFRGQLLNQTFPNGLAGLLVYALPATELAAVILILWPSQTLRGLYLSLALLSAFTLYIGMVLLHFWNRTPCSCGGVLSHMGWQAHFLFNLFFITLNIAAIHTERGKNPDKLSPGDLS